MPVLIAFHGDEGTPNVITSFLTQAAEANGYILFAPQCPLAGGCNTGSWWRWNQPMSWAFSQLDTLQAQYNVDLNRVYAIGGSGGAVYLGYRSDELSPRVAGFAMVSGGFSSYSGACQACKIPLYILIGDQDFLLSQTQQARTFFEQCGNEVVFDLLPGVDHQGGGQSLATGKGSEILQWFGARSNRCLP